MKILTNEEMNEIKGGEVITIAAVMAVLAAALVAVIAYKLFMSQKGTTTMPGGWKFTWN